MFRSRIIVTPLDSDAVSKLEWNSETEVLFVNYVSGTKTYRTDGVTFESFTILCHEANRLGSWGSALHHWKAKHEADSYAKDKEAFDKWASNASQASMERWTSWLNSSYKDKIATKIKNNVRSY